MKKITFECPDCKTCQTLTIDNHKDQIEFPCGSCQKKLSLNHLNQDFTNICPVCDCKDLHQHKDFNKSIGILVFIIGAVLAPWTYYLSLIGALIVDALLYPFFPWMSVCYQCKAELRGWEKNPKLDRFNHEIAAHYEYRKT